MSLDRQATSASQSLAILKRIAETLRRLKESRTYLPQSSMGLAFAYTLNL